MKIRIQISKNQNCSKPSEIIDLCSPEPDQKAHSSNRVEDKVRMVSALTFFQKLNEIIEQENESYCNNGLLFQDWYTYISNYKRSLDASLNRILKLIANQIKLIGKNKENLQKIGKSGTDHQKIAAEIQLKTQNNEKENELVQKQIKQQLTVFKNKYIQSAEELINQLNQVKNLYINKEQLKKVKPQVEIFEACQQKIENTCLAVAFNGESNILVVACKKEIIIYQLLKGEIIKELQRLNDHTSKALYFMKKSNSFVSESQDYSIIIWEFDYNKNQWFAQSYLKDHTNRVCCLKMNNCEELLISGSIDHTIKFWYKVNSEWNIQQTFDAKHIVWDLSLNDKENKLIFELFLSIQILVKGNDNIWIRIQSIEIDCARLCFTVEDQFIVQHDESDKIDIYDYDESKEQFEKFQEVKTSKYEQDSAFFPCQYIKKQSVMAIKCSKYLNLFKINLDRKYQLIKTIKFQDCGINGKLSDDGKYLVTWNDQYQQIEVNILSWIE